MTTIQKEPFSEALCKEILPLAQKCWDEGTELKGETCSYHEFRKGIVIEPDFDLYRQLAEVGRLVIFSIRDSRLVGYVVAYVYRSPHHVKLLVANGDSIYIEVEYRSYAAAIIKPLLTELKTMGAVSMGWAVSQNGPMYELLKSLGFVGDEIIMEKLLCA